VYRAHAQRVKQVSPSIRRRGCSRRVLIRRRHADQV